ncbi:LppX_LprAFG lipoprotein [Frankia sp. Cr2]|uniref:LppX_LprAFG lipoprotein n=1 Tax=Frankia sp. Cr2 TaxID=3073932 RepID=UPI002AD24CCF|nr:LppX_LprAFG lipoprotein [Frankia sp. Cr2]
MARILGRNVQVTTGSIVALAASLLLSTAACSSDSAEPPPTAIASTSIPSATRTSAVPIPLESAYTTTIARKTARIHFTYGATLVSVAGRKQTISTTGTGTVDFAHSTSQTVRDVDGGGRSEVRIIGPDFYQRSVTAGGAPSSTRWTRVVPGGGASGSATSPSSATSPATSPSSVQPGAGDDAALRLGFLSGAAAPVTTVGEESVDGVRTIHYKLSVNLETASQRGNISAATVDYYKGILGTVLQPTEAWIDADGLIRQLRITVTSAASDSPAPHTEIIRTVTYSDFGLPLNITAPAPNEIVPG